MVSEVDDIFVILDPSLKSIKNVQGTQKITQELDIRYKNFYLVANHKFSDDLEEQFRHMEGTSYLGKIDYDMNAEKYNLTGRSLLELPEDSPACSSVARILAKAGLGGN